MVRTAVRDLERLTGNRLGDPERPLLVSVRSGAPVSMPGMLDTVLDVGITPAVAATGPDDRRRDVRRRHLPTVPHRLGVHRGWAAGRCRRSVGSAATSADDLLRRLADAGCAIPLDPDDAVVAATEAVYRSWDGERARAFRRHEGIDDTLGTAVTIQAMVFGNLGPDSGTGVAFSRDPSTGEPGMVGDLLFGAQGDDVVGGAMITSPLGELACGGRRCTRS